MSDILLIEDSRVQAVTYRRLLEEAGHTVRHAATAEEAFQVCLDTTPDIVVLDQYLGDKSGLEVCRRLKGDITLQVIPILVLTGSQKERDHIAALDAGADRFLSKESTDEQLLAVVAGLLKTALPVESVESDTDARDAFLRGGRVLAIDDSRTYLNELHKRLSESGFNVTTATSGPDGLALLTSEAFHIAIVDVVMPEMDGLEFARRVRDMPDMADAKMIILSSASIADEAARFRQLDIAHRLTKPIKQSDLLNAVLAALGIRARDAAAAKPATSAAISGRPAHVPSLRIPLAEDNPVNQQVAIGFLRERGHDVVVANNGREVLAALEEGAFDLILMDVQMPEMDGLEATKAIRERERETGLHIPIIAVTASAMKRDQEHCIEAGMDSYVSKPVYADELYRAVEGIVGSRRRKVPGGEVQSLSSSEADEQATLSPDQNDDATVLDWDTAVNRMQGDEEQLKELARLFLDVCPKTLQEVQGAVGGHDAEKTLQRAAHTLKGSADLFAAERVVEAAWRLEIMGRDGDLDGADEALAGLEKEVCALMQALGKRCGKTDITVPPSAST